MNFTVTCVNISDHLIRQINSLMRNAFVTYYSLTTCFDRCRDDHHQGSLQDYKESKNLFKCIIEPLNPTKNVSNFLLSFNIGLFTAKI